MSDTDCVTSFELREGRQQCPAHNGRRPSLSIRRSADGRWLLHCFAGCTTEAVLRTAGLTWADLYPDGVARPRQPRRHWRRELEAPLIAHERRAQMRLEPWIPIYGVNDFIRTERQAIAETRALVSALGDVERVWPVLAAVADRERFVTAIEAELDAVVGDL